MASFASLFACAAADLTYQRVLALVDEQPPESLTLEFKEKYSPGVPKSIAAMANSYGGIIIIGVTDAGVDRVVGVPVEAITQVANGCYERLEPPWEPEIVPVPIPGADGRFLLVVRVDPVRAPRPILIGGTVPIRLNGRNATADRGRLAQLFAEAAPAVRTERWLLPQPTLETDADGSPTADFVIRSGMWIPVDVAATWRALSERGIDSIAATLNTSPLATQLLRWISALGCPDFNAFHRSGFNRARRARLAWRASMPAPTRPPVETTVELQLPDTYGVSNSAMQVTFDVLLRASALRPTSQSLPGLQWRLDIPSLYSTIDALIQTLTDTSLVATLADLAGVDAALVPQPSSLHFVTGFAVDELLRLSGLSQVPEAGSSHGANLVADPARDLSNTTARRIQIDDWLLQIGLDAGLRGMEDLIVQLHDQGELSAYAEIVEVDE